MNRTLLACALALALLAAPAEAARISTVDLDFDLPDGWRDVKAADPELRDDPDWLGVWRLGDEPARSALVVIRPIELEPGFDAEAVIDEMVRQTEGTIEARRKLALDGAEAVELRVRRESPDAPARERLTIYALPGWHGYQIHVDAPADDAALREAAKRAADSLRGSLRWKVARQRPKPPAVALTGSSAGATGFTAGALAFELAPGWRTMPVEPGHEDHEELRFGREGAYRVMFTVKTWPGTVAAVCDRLRSDSKRQGKVSPTRTPMRSAGRPAMEFDCRVANGLNATTVCIQEGDHVVVLTVGSLAASAEQVREEARRLLERAR